MAQVPIREYDAKRLWSVWSETPYNGILVETQEQIQTLAERLQNEKIAFWVVKPDQLFGKRGKLGLVAVKLEAIGVQQRCEAHWQKMVTINGVTDVLHTFLIEPWIPHTEELYVSFSTNREGDLIRFSPQGGIAVEEHWDKIHAITVPVLEDLDETQLMIPMEKSIKTFIVRLYQFFKEQGLTSLEINPFVVDTAGAIYCLDMVATVDSYALWEHAYRENVTRVKPFGIKTHPSELIVAAIDEKTGASCKLTVINPEGRLWFLFGGGGASVIVMDTLAERSLLHEVANYGELSGNPDESSNRVYVSTLIETMLANKQTGKYLFLVGGIANFTDIVALVKPLCDCITQYAGELRKQKVTLVMRRGGLRTEEAMFLFNKTCVDNEIPCIVYDDTFSLTKAFDSLVL